MFQTANRRSSLNIVAICGRSLYALVIGLFSGRWTLKVNGRNWYNMAMMRDKQNLLVQSTYTRGSVPLKLGLFVTHRFINTGAWFKYKGVCQWG